MGKIISISNSKGGVAKTTTVMNLGAGLAICGYKVLLLDLDVQQNLTNVMTGEMNHELTIVNVLEEEIIFDEAIQSTNIPTLFIIPSDTKLSNYRFENEVHLKSILIDEKDNYDFILIDCPPTIGDLVTNILVASDSVIVPIQCEYMAMDSVSNIIGLIKDIKKTFNKELYIEDVLFTMFDSRTNQSIEIVDDAKKRFKSVNYFIIRRLAKINQSPKYGKSIFEYDKNSQAAKEYGYYLEHFMIRHDLNFDSTKISANPEQIKVKRNLKDKVINLLIRD